ncbi:MAG: hypothetical protein GC154_18890 [bacterium]|nr:hypothetical protein [bacterium]
MMYKYSSYQLIGLTIIAFWLSGCATTTPPPPKWTPLNASEFEQPLTLDRCIELALKNDVQAAQWKARLDAAHSDIQQAKIPPNPTFSPSWDDIGLKDDVGTNLGNLTYGISFPILFWWPRPKKIEAAEANRMVEEAAILAERRQLKIGIATAYFNLTAEQRVVRLNEELLAIADESVRLVSKQVELDLASNLELQRAISERLQAQSDLADARSQLRIDSLAFAFALGADQPYYPILADPDNQFTELTADDGSPITMNDHILNAALEHDPDLMEKRAATRYALAQLDLEHRNAIPFADVGGSAGPKDAPEGTGSAFSLDIPIPLFDQNQAGISKAEADLLAARAEEEKTRRTAVANLTQAWETYQAQREKWTLYTQALGEKATENAAGARKLFELGRIQYSDLLLAQRDANQTRMNAVNDWRDLCISCWLAGELFQYDPTE